MTGRRVPAQYAENIGLIDRLWPQSEMRAAAESLASELCCKATLKHCGDQSDRRNKQRGPGST